MDEISDANDIDGDVIVYNISKVLSGELTVNGVKVDGINLNKGQEAIWQPGLDVNGDKSLYLNYLYWIKLVNLNQQL